MLSWGKRSGYAVVVLGIVSLALFSGCGGSKPVYFSLTQMDSPESKQKLARTYLKVTSPKTLAKVKRVVIPACNIELIAKSSATASSYAGGGNSASVDVSYALDGLDTARIRATADSLYDNLVLQLTTAGYEVVPVESVVASETYKLMTAEPNPRAGKSYLEKGKAQSLTFAPKGLSVYFTPNDPYSPFTNSISQSIKQGKGKANTNYEAKLMADFGADAIVKARYCIGFTSFKKSSSGGAKIKASLNYTMAAGSNMVRFQVGYSKSRGDVYNLKNDIVTISLVKPMVSDAPIVTDIKDVTSTGTKVGMAVLNTVNVAASLFGGGGAHRGKIVNYSATVDNDVYLKTTTNYVGCFNDLLACKLKNPQN